MKYLEDRIDHTLFDLKRYCEGEEDCKLKIAFEGSKTKKWIDSFGKKFNKIVESMGIVGIFVNENYEVYDLEKCDNTLLAELQDNYLNPRNKGYLSSWTERYYKNVKNKIDDFLKSASVMYSQGI